MKRYPKVTIIILNHNGVKDTRICLDSLIRTIYPNFKILLVDNGSTVNETEILRKEFLDKRIEMIRLGKNLGFSGGNNAAFKRVRGKYVVLLNNDTFVQKDWLGHLVSAMEEDKRIAVAQPKILFAKDKSKFDYSGASGGFIDSFGYPFTRGRIFNNLEDDRSQYDDIREIFWASGAAMIFKRAVVSRVCGLFEKEFFNYMEEIDFCWRVWNTGYKVVAIPSSVIYHKVASTAKRNLLKKRFYEHRNNLLLLIKNMPRDTLIKIIPIRVFLEICSYFFYLTSLKFNYVLALFLAHADFIRLLPAFWQKRKAYAIFPVHYEGSIAIEYFIKKRKHFWQLDWIGKGVGERTFSEFSYLAPTFKQHQAVYNFCLKFVKKKKVLDLGCGSGSGTFSLSHIARSVVGIDIDEGSIRQAKSRYKNKNLKFLTPDILENNLGNSFDVATSLQVIEHVGDVNRYLHNVKKGLKAHGIFIVSTPNKKTQSFNENPYHIQEFSPKELRSLLEVNFSKVKLYGLFGDKHVQAYEKERKKKVETIMKLDFLRIRKILPRKIKVYLFEFLIPFVRNFVAVAKRSDFFDIDVSSYKIRPETRGSIDLIAVCQK